MKGSKRRKIWVVEYIEGNQRITSDPMLRGEAKSIYDAIDGKGWRVAMLNINTGEIIKNDV